MTAPESLDLRKYRRVVVVTGAGISAPSGIPTYRDTESHWSDERLERISHASRYGMHLAELWQFWGALRARATAALPNAAHLALAATEAACREAGGWLTIATQNVDGLHTAAGNREVVELHGRITQSRCMRKGCGPAFPDRRVPEPHEVPRCPQCGRNTRPDIVLFGERLSGSAMRALDARLRTADLCLYVGTSGNVWPVRDLVSTARSAGARCVLVNAEDWIQPHPDFHHTALGAAEHLLPTLLGAPAGGRDPGRIFP
ncbi:SIR2 family NAD-dependent protein deacylase [Embleya sp. NPDC001921]